MRGVTIGAAILLVQVGAIHARAGAGLSMDDLVTMEECEGRLAADPDELDSYLCFWIVSRKGQPGPAARRLTELLRHEPDNHKAALYLAVIRADQLRPDALDLARRAAAGLAADGDALGEARAQLLLDLLLRYRGSIGEADTALSRALETARISGDRDAIAQAETAQAAARLLDGDYSTAWSLNRKLEKDLFPDGPSWLQFRVLDGLGRTALSTGRLHQAFDYYRRSADLLAQHGNIFAEAHSRYSMAQVAAELRIVGDVQGEEVRRLTEEALEATRRGGNRAVEALVLLLRAQLPERDLPSRLGDARAGLALARKSGDAEDIGSGLRLLASLMMEKGSSADFAAALGVVGEAIALAQDSGWPQEIAAAYLARAAIATGHLPRAEVIADYLAAIDQIEKLRDLQSNRYIRGRFLWDWASAYYLLARFALDDRGLNTTEGDLDLALATMERLRGRLMIDLLDSAGATAAAFPAGPERDAFVAARQRIVATQRRLLSPGLSEQDRRAAMAALERLELEETYLVTRLERTRPAYATLNRRQIPTIASLQSSLQDDQALISYQIPTPDRSGGGEGWVLVLSRERMSVHRLPARGPLEERIAMFIGLLQRRDALEPEAAARLFDDLLAGPLSGLPARVSRLLVIPDGALHRLPFGALRESPSGRPLATRYDISLIPSASLWSHWKRTSPAPIGSAVLALADPAIAGMESARPAAERSVSLSDDLVLGPLPYARSEARSVVRRIGGASRLLIGDEASERRLKQTDLRPFGVLHFATHAVVDEREPQRSAIVLAPGGPMEDGLLQLREIVAMDLGDRLIILSACSSASGELTAGEGIVGLAGGLFQAGARAVVGGLWPLRDDEAAVMVGDLAQELSRGASIGAALTAARRSRIAAGAPTASWAGMVVLGDADLVPLPGGRQEVGARPLRGPLVLFAGILATLLILLILRWLARSRRPV